ncbi:MAG: hypothetical protein WC091_01365 [Sulfuricellaceae bacterium]
MIFAEFIKCDIRLVALRILSEMPGFKANSSVICTLLDQFGHTATRDQTKTELRWLEENGLVAIEEAGSVLVATLKERGHEVAEGRAKVDGVAKPKPKA